MLIFLEKVRTRTLFSMFEPIVTEPLELVYLQSALEELNIEAKNIGTKNIEANNIETRIIETKIIDPLFREDEPSEQPDMVILTGYNVAEDRMIERARYWKQKYDHILVMVSGVHVQLNVHAFKKSDIDYIFHSQDLKLFQTLVQHIAEGKEIVNFSGLDVNLGGGNWQEGKREASLDLERMIPQRTFFEKHKKKLKYLDKKNLVLIKGGRACPYDCSYCYCKSLNNSHYLAPDFFDLFQQMKAVDAENYWIVDDILMDSKNSAKAFVAASQEVNFDKNIIGYLRADFIVKHKEMLQELKNAGLSEVIVGFETPDKKELIQYNKNLDGEIYSEAIALLKKNNIDLTALFMVHPNYGWRDFTKLWRFLWTNRLKVYTISIFTPLKGSKEYKDYEDKLTTNKKEKFDFLHLVLPSKLPKAVFYTLFYLSHSGLIFSKRIWRYLMR